MQRQPNDVLKNRYNKMDIPSEEPCRFPKIESEVMSINLNRKPHNVTRIIKMQKEKEPVKSIVKKPDFVIFRNQKRERNRKKRQTGEKRKKEKTFLTISCDQLLIGDFQLAGDQVESRSMLP